MRGSLRGADFVGCTAALWVSRKPDRESNMISLGELMGMTPAELYIKSFSQPYEQKVLVGHAIVSLIDSFDRAASRGIPDSPSGGCKVSIVFVVLQSLRRIAISMWKSIEPTQ